jgi:hypothetical protein
MFGSQWNAQASPIGDYGGGGSGVGEAAMLVAKQQTAPMSRMLGRGACSALSLTQASGIVLGIDGIGVWASNAVISANTACNGAPSTGQCTADPSGLAFSGAGGNPMGFTNWRDVLALLYGGLDRSTGVTDCASAKRATLISNWSNLFQNSACTNGALFLSGALTHAWRLDDASGTADSFSSLIGIQATWKDPNGNSFAGSPASAVAVNGFMTSPFCNAMNWDQIEVTARACANAAPNHYIGPGGIVGPDGEHHVPPPGTYGSVAAGAQPFVFPTAFQDNDPIRTACLGNATANRVAEDVCNDDGKLGVVLPIPALDFIKIQNPNLVAYPSAVQCSGGFTTGASPKVFLCAPRGQGTFFGTSPCPNNDIPFPFGCFIPVGPGPNGPTSQCLATKAEAPTLCNLNPCPAAEGRIYNEQIYDGTAGTTVGYLNLSIPEPTFTQLITHTGGYARIHMREVSTPGANNCQLADATDQIGCLVQADQHSIGFAGRTAGTWEARDPVAGHTGTGETVAVRVNQLQPGFGCTPSVPGVGASYALWRKLYFNSIFGFGRLSSAAELALAEFVSFDQNEAPILLNYGFLELPFSPNGADPVGVPNPFCEDFNEALVCSTLSNLNGCAFNTTTDAVGGAPLVNTTIPSFLSNAPNPVFTPGCAGLPAGSPGCTIPSDPSSNPTQSTTSTVCGNGKIELFEDCDPVAPASSPNCSFTCRSTL